MRPESGKHLDCSSHSCDPPRCHRICIVGLYENTVQYVFLCLHAERSLTRTVNYLIHPQPGTLAAPRVGSAVAVLVIYYILLIPVLVCYARLIYTILTDPGFLPYGPQWYAQHHTDRASHSNGLTTHGENDALPPEKKSQDDSSGCSTSRGPDLEAGSKHNIGMEFWHKDIFICNYDGRPAWCSTCMNFKPDRTHHCREVNRCVLKMDHFCPWVGGIVSETSLKFFMQLAAYTVLYTIHCLISMAYFVAERRKKTGELDVNMVVTVALGGLFLLFSFGITSSSVQLAMTNLTTVENLTKNTKVWYIAVLIPRPELSPPAGQPPKFMTITYPRPPEEQLILQQHGGYVPPAADTPSDNPMRSSSRAPSHYIPPRTFAILETRKGENPFDLGRLENLKQVLGYNCLDWILPWKRSPCADHSSPISSFKMNDDLIKRLQVEAGLLSEGEDNSEKRRHHGRSGKRNSIQGTNTEEGGSEERRRRHRRRHGRYHGRRQSQRGPARSRSSRREGRTARDGTEMHEVVADVR